MHPYPHASVVFVDIGEDFEDDTTTGIAAGVVFALHHAIEVENIQFATKLKPNLWGGNYYGERSDFKFNETLLTYRYSFFVTPRFRLFVGGSGGVVTLKYTRDYFDYRGARENRRAHAQSDAPLWFRPSQRAAA
ncbi:MAG: hypothetical protein QM790_17705 [Nibricoccus sp.]